VIEVLEIKTPRLYINKAGALRESGALASNIANRVFIAGGPRALAAAGSALTESLERAGVAYERMEYGGYPTWEISETVAGKAREFGAGALVAVGGGKIHDLTKAAGEITGLPVISVPTIAATCAAWAALSVIYDENGAYQKHISLKESPKLIILDRELLASAPTRYLNAGIADSLAKWYEFESMFDSGDLFLKLQLKTADMARELLENEGLRIAGEIEDGFADMRTFGEILDAIIALAGICGSYATGAARGGFAHPFYDQLTKLPETRDKLHGEKVSFGLVVQAILENHKNIDSFISVFVALRQPLTLEALGIVENAEEKIRRLSLDVAGRCHDFRPKGLPPSASDIESAIYRANDAATGCLAATQGQEAL
jgi:glycerol dehydrogenase